jgi:hypothetical protein
MEPCGTGMSIRHRRAAAACLDARGWPALGVLIPRAFEGSRRVDPRRCFPQERGDPSFSHGRLFDIGQERGNWPQMQLVLQSWGP